MQVFFSIHSYFFFFTHILYQGSDKNDDVFSKKYPKICGQAGSAFFSAGRFSWMYQSFCLRLVTWSGPGSSILSGQRVYLGTSKAAVFPVPSFFSSLLLQIQAQDSALPIFKIPWRSLRNLFYYRVILHLYRNHRTKFSYH